MFTSVVCILNTEIFVQMLTEMIGPNVAAREIKKACKAATTREVNFSFWKEHF